MQPLLQIFVCLMLVVIVSCKKILENTHIKFLNFDFFNSSGWLEFECLNFIRMFQSSCYHFKIKLATETYVHFSRWKQKKTIKKLEVYSSPNLVKSSEHVTLADAETINKELKAVTSI